MIAIEAVINFLLVVWVVGGIIGSYMVKEYVGENAGYGLLLVVALVYGFGSEWNGGYLNQALGMALKFILK